MRMVARANTNTPDIFKGPLGVKQTVLKSCKDTVRTQNQEDIKIDIRDG